MRHRVLFSPEAREDLEGLYDYIALHGHPATALAYVERLETFCLQLCDFPERGMRRDEIRHGLRTTGFERRVTLAFHLNGDTVIIDRLLYGGRDLAAAVHPVGR